MAHSPSDAAAAPAAAGESASDGSDEERFVARRGEHSASPERIDDGISGDEARPHDSPNVPGDVIDDVGPRTNLSQDSIAQLRAQHKQLKKEQKRLRQEVKNTTRKRQRVLARMRHLDTASVLQVLAERGVSFGAPAAAAAAMVPAVGRALPPPAGRAREPSAPRRRPASSAPSEAG